MSLDEYGEWVYLGDVSPKYFQWLSTGINSKEPTQILRVSFKDLPNNPTYSKIRIRGILYAPTTTIFTQSRIVYPSPDRQVIELAFPLIFLEKASWELGIEVIKIKLKKWSDLDDSLYKVDIENYKGFSALEQLDAFDENLDYLSPYNAALNE